MLVPIGAGDRGGRVCIDENLALDFVRGRLPPASVREVDEHADACESCRVLLDEAVRSFRDRATLDVPATAARMTVFSVGDMLSGRYRITRFIARGGMGEVYEAEDLLLAARLAVKTMSAAISDDPAAIRRLKQEVNLARRITHPNVCRIFDIGIHEPSNPSPGERVLFLTMELIAGVSLGERLRARGAISQTEARPIIEAMVAALLAAHRAGVVHRDFKSDNVMLSNPDNGHASRVVVMDFGLAREASHRSGTSVPEGGLTGTLAYMAPEQLEGKTPTPASDTYALGIVMFEMLTGRLPFDGEPPLGGALKRLVEVAPPLRSFVPAVDPSWDAIVQRCLERDPGRRPQSMEDLASVFREQPGQSVGPTTVRKLPRKRGAWLVGAGGIALMAMLVSWLSFHKADRSPTPVREISRPAAEFPSVATSTRATPPATASVPTQTPTPPATLIPPREALDGKSPRGKPTSGRTNRDRRPAVRPGSGDPSGWRDAPASAVPAPEPPPAVTVPPNRRSQDPEDGFIFPASAAPER